MVRLISVVALVCFTGCATHTSVCPDFPTPSQKVLDSIKSLDNPEVDDWIVNLYKLNQKLKICKER